MAVRRFTASSSTALHPIQVHQVLPVILRSRVTRQGGTLLREATLLREVTVHPVGKAGRQVSAACPHILRWCQAPAQTHLTASIR